VIEFGSERLTGAIVFSFEEPSRLIPSAVRPHPLKSVPIRDAFERPLRSLRVSVTDRCNLRCVYCMPEEDYTWLPREELLSFNELARLVEVFTELGVARVRITGGEPLLRPGLDGLVRVLAANPRIEDLALTTNGVLLAEQAEALRLAGLHRITISLDTLLPERFLAMTRHDNHARVLAGIAAARRVGLEGTKLDTVVVRGINDAELVNLIEFGCANGVEVRFIEYMDVPGATKWVRERVVSRAEMLARLELHYGQITAIPEDTSAPASRFLLPNGTVLGIIASTTMPFCARCDRSRLTADGMWYRCLYATAGTDLRRALRSGAPHEEISATLAARIRNGWQGRKDRGAERRKAVRFRGAFVPIDGLGRDLHFEMHTRGG
jgi:cyclic pyranopterin phosphate synthase